MSSLFIECKYTIRNGLGFAVTAIDLGSVPCIWSLRLLLRDHLHGHEALDRFALARLVTTGQKLHLDVSHIRCSRLPVRTSAQLLAARVMAGQRAHLRDWTLCCGVCRRMAASHFHWKVSVGLLSKEIPLQRLDPLGLCPHLVWILFWVGAAARFSAPRSYQHDRMTRVRTPYDLFGRTAEGKNHA